MIAPRRVRKTLILCAAVASLLQLAPPARPLPQSGTEGSQAPPAAHDARAASAEPTTKTITVTVSEEAGRFITGLKAGNFTVFDGDQQREITAFGEGDVPSTIGILVDASGSMFSKSYAATIRDALLVFLRKCNASDEYFLMAFNQSPQLLLERSSDPMAVMSAMDKFAAAARMKGQTALYDALYLAVSHAGRGKHRKRAILLITDGQDNVSHYNFSELRRQVKESDVIIYTVSLAGANDNSELGYGGRAILEELAGVSGGKSYFPTRGQSGELYDSMERIAIELRAQYMIGFTPAPATRKDGWHEVRVKLTELHDERGKKLKVYLRGRPGFYDSTVVPK
jgi:Ca-activated chloride channel family protein